MCPDFFSSVYRFATEKVSKVRSDFDFHQKRKSRHTRENLYRYVCRDLSFKENANLNTLDRENLDGQKLLGVSTSEGEKKYRSAPLWRARTCAEIAFIENQFPIEALY